MCLRHSGEIRVAAAVRFSLSSRLQCCNYVSKLTRKGPVLHPEFRTHIFPGGRAPSQSDEMDIHFCSIAPS